MHSIKPYEEMVRAHRFMCGDMCSQGLTLHLMSSDVPKVFQNFPPPSLERTSSIHANFEYPSTFKNSKLVTHGHPLKLYLNISSL